MHESTIVPNEALEMMQNAKRLMYRYLGEPEGRNRSLAEGLESLETAIALAEHPETEIPLCPACGGLYTMELPWGLLTCLSCDERWFKERARKVHE